jgi:hypothetical protein
MGEKLLTLLLLPSTSFESMVYLHTLVGLLQAWGT